MIRQSARILKNEQGYMLLLAVFILMAATFLGIFSTTTSTIETQIAGNDSAYKRAFYAAEGGTEVAESLIIENIAERGFSSPNQLYKNSDIFVLDNTFYMNTYNTAYEDTNEFREYCKPPSDSDYAFDTNDGRHWHFYYPYTGDPDAVPVTRIKIAGSNSSLSAGSAIQMIAGYEGKGKSSADAGAQIVYDIRSQYEGVNNDRAVVRIFWRYRF
jgi:hypothetical protein